MALLAVILVAGMLAAVSIMMLRMQMHRATRVRSDRDYLVATAAARGAVHRGIAILRDSPSRRGLIATEPLTHAGDLDGSIEVIELNNGFLRIRGTAEYQGVTAVEEMVISGSKL